jgi:hypothetical protein
MRDKRRPLVASQLGIHSWRIYKSSSGILFSPNGQPDSNHSLFSVEASMTVSILLPSSLWGAGIALKAEVLTQLLFELVGWVDLK